MHKQVQKQIEITLSSRRFNISLSDFNEKAYNEVQTLFANKDLDLLDLIRAYITSVQEKYELESRLEAMIEKIPSVG